MDQEEIGRLSVIYHHLDFWKTRDPKYQDKIGFLAYLENCDLGCYPVKDTEKWLKLRTEARQNRSTIPETLFDHWRNLAQKTISINTEPERPAHAEIDVLTSDQRKDLEEITNRLKKADPARAKKN